MDPVFTLCEGSGFAARASHRGPDTSSLG